MNTVLQLDNLRTEFRMRSSTVVAVDGVSLDVVEGECVGIVGESGCGKSTTGLSIMRLLPANGHVTGGSITLLGRDLATLDEKAMRQVRGEEVALIPQDPMTSLNPTMTIGRQIAEGVRLHRKVSRARARERALEVLRLVEMPQPAERLGQYPHELSGGLRQRVMIAMALACEPKLLIADEPTTALDVTIQAQILDLIDGLRQRLAMAVVLITHDMGVIAGRTDRVVVMYAGKVAEEAETGELFNRIRHPYSEALLASVPKLDQRRDERLLSIAGLPPDLSRTITNCRFAPRCPYATDRCWEEDPPLIEAGGPSSMVHRYACFHPVDHSNRVQPVAVRLSPETVAAAAQRTADLTTASPIVEVAGLVKEFPVMAGSVLRHQVGSVKAVTGVSFDVRTGETFGLVGESGCGKTTVGRLLVGLDRPTAGSIRFEGTEMASLRAGQLRSRRRDLQIDVPGPVRLTGSSDAGRDHHPGAVEGPLVGLPR